MECYLGNSLGKKGKITDKFRIGTKSEEWYLIISAPSSSQGDQSKLRGPEESLFEHSPGVGREEQPPIAVVVQVQESGSAIYKSFVFVYIFGYD